MRIAAELLSFAIVYMTNVFQYFVIYAKSKTSAAIGSHPEIFSIDKAFVDSAHTKHSSSTSIDFSDWASTKGSISSILEIAVAPELSKKQKKTIRKFDDKLDAILAIADFVPNMKKQMNKQVKKLTHNAFDVDDIDKMMHKILHKP